MRKKLILVIVVFVFGFSGSASALALYHINGQYPAANDVHVEGTLGIKGINSFNDLEAGRSYEWFYNLTFTDWNYWSEEPPYWISTESHWGNVDCTFVKRNNPDYLTFSLKGDEGSLIDGSDNTVWTDSNAGSFFYASYHLTEGAPQDEVPKHSVPEPSAMVLLGSGLIGLGVFKKKVKM